MIQQIELHCEPITKSRMNEMQATLARRGRVALGSSLALIALSVIATSGWFCWGSILAGLFLFYHFRRVSAQRAALSLAATPISGEACRKMAQWWDQYPIINEYCRRVVGQGREIVQAEFEAADGYVKTQTTKAYQNALYERTDTLPSPVDDALLASLAETLAIAPCKETVEAITLIEQHRGQNFDDPRAVKEFIDRLWDCVSRALDHGNYPSEALDALSNLEIDLAQRSISLRRVDFGTMSA